MNHNDKKIKLVFPQSEINEEKDNRFVSKGHGQKIINQFAADVDDIANWFNQYEIDSIELWISGGVETDGLLRLAVSAKGEGGMKLTLRPKQKKNNN